jgi:DNA-binding MarR family transcriptional regulator
MRETIKPEIVKIEEDFRQVCVKIKKKGRTILNNFEITPPQFAALLELIEHGDMTIGDLSSRMYLACSTVTDLLDRMERNQLVVRIKDEKDRRIVRIQVLEKGHHLIEEVLYARRLYIQGILAEMPSNSIEEIERCFSYLNKNMSI